MVRSEGLDRDISRSSGDGTGQSSVTVGLSSCLGTRTPARHAAMTHDRRDLRERVIPLPRSPPSPPIPIPGRVLP